MYTKGSKKQIKGNETEIRMERKVAKGLTESKRNTELGIRIVAYIMVSLRLGDGQQIF
jgi:hypothetical protein